MKLAIKLWTILFVLLTFSSYGQLEQLMNRSLGNKKKKDATEAAPAPTEKKKTMYEQAISETEPYLVKMKFSNAPIQETTFSESSVVPSFSGSDRIYGRVFFDKPVKDILTNYYRIDLIAMIPGDYTSVAQFKAQWCNLGDLNSAELEKSYLDIPVIPDPKAVDESKLKVTDCMIGGFQYGQHKYRIILDCRGVDYRGDFDFNVTDETKRQRDADKLLREELKKVAKKDSERDEFKRRAASANIDEEFYSSHGSFKDPNLTIAKIKSYLLQQEKDIVQILHVSIEDGSGDWEIVWNKDVYPNIPDHKITVREIYTIWKAKDGYCYYYTLKGKRKYHSGDGSYGDTYLYSYYSASPINCDRVKLPAK